LHDSIALEAEGVPTAVVATTAFLDAAAAQAEHLGMPEYRIVTVEHPVQPCNEAEMHERAEAVVRQIVSRLTTGA